MATTLGGIVWTIGRKGVLVGSYNDVAVVTIAGLANLSTGEGGSVLVGTGESKIELAETDVKFEKTEVKDDEGNNVISYTGTVTLGESVLAMQNKASVSLTNGQYDGKTYAGKLSIGSAQSVQIEADETDSTKSSEHLEYTAKNGTATIVANLTEGYVVAANGLSASYSAAADNVVLATISGLNRGYTDETKISLGDTAQNDGEGVITLTMGADTDKVAVLGASNVAIAKNTKNAFANTQNYYLRLASDYKQTAGSNYWGEVSKGSSSYKFETSDGYVYNSAGDYTADAKDTQINYQKAFTTVIATVSGLKDGVEVSDNGTSLGTYDGTYTAGLTITDVGTPTEFNNKGVAANKGAITVTANDNVLPTPKGTLKVVAGTNYSSEKITTEEPGTNGYVKIADKAAKLNGYSEFNTNGLYQNIWVISGNTAIYKKVRLAYYDTSVANQVTYVPQADVITLATVKGFSTEALESAAQTTTVKGSTVITSIGGLTFSGTVPDATLEKDAKGRDVWTRTDPVTLTVGSNLLGNSNVVIGKSDAVTLKVSDTVAPTFSEQKWNLSGTTATLKGTINAGYTASDDGKTIVYTKGGENQTLATVTGLRKNTELIVPEGSNDPRAIGYGSGTDGAFVTGLIDARETDDKLTYDADGKLKKLDITVSANVLDTSKVALKSTFYKLALDDGTDTTKGGKVVTTADTATQKYFTVSGTTATYKQAASRPYYTMDEAGTSITYNGEKSAVTLATVTGINANTNINIYGTNSDQSDANDIYINENGVITVKQNALNEATIKVNPATKNLPTGVDPSKFTLALGTITNPSALKWTQTGNTVYLKADPGYQVSADAKSIAYTQTGKETVIAQITGLRAGMFDATTGTTAFNGTEVNSAVSAKGITLNNNAGAGKITLALSALNNANVALTGTGNYKLAVDTSDDDTKKVPTTAKTGQNEWVVSGNSAVFKNVDTAYYDTTNLSTKTRLLTKGRQM